MLTTTPGNFIDFGTAEQHEERLRDEVKLAVFTLELKRMLDRLEVLGYRGMRNDYKNSTAGTSS